MAKKVEDKNPVGRPADYTDELANKICDLIACSNKGLATICKDEKLPARSTIYEWIDKHKEFSDKYARAREDQADFLAEEILEIADDSSRDTKTIKGKDGKDIEVEDTEWTNRSKLRVDARKWTAARLCSKRWGDKVQTEHSGSLAIVPITGMEVK